MYLIKILQQLTKIGRAPPNLDPDSLIVGIRYFFPEFSTRDIISLPIIKTFNALDFIAEVTSHIPPKHKQYIRRYELYSSRSRGVWDLYSHIVRLAPQGWKEKHNKKTDSEEHLPETKEYSVDEKQR